jgi:hypothetical protein
MGKRAWGLLAFLSAAAWQIIYRYFWEFVRSLGYEQLSKAVHMLVDQIPMAWVEQFGPSVILAGVGGYLFLKSKPVEMPPTLTQPNADNRQWLYSYDMYNLADRELALLATTESEKFGELDQEFENLNYQLMAMSSAKGLTLAAGIAIPETKDIVQIRERMNVVLRQREEQRHKRNQSSLRVVDDLYEKLRNGAIIAKGCLAPVSNNAEEIPIPSWQWRFLRLNNTLTEASGENITYKAVTAARAE